MDERMPTRLFVKMMILLGVLFGILCGCYAIWGSEKNIIYGLGLAGFGTSASVYYISLIITQLCAYIVGYHLDLMDRMPVSSIYLVMSKLAPAKYSIIVFSGSAINILGIGLFLVGCFIFSVWAMAMILILSFIIKAIYEFILTKNEKLALYIDPLSAMYAPFIGVVTAVIAIIYAIIYFAS